MQNTQQIQNPIFAPRVHSRVFFTTIIWNLVYFIVAMLLYPTPFSFRTVWISSLGNPVIYNHVWVFNLGVFTTGLLLLYHFVYLEYHSNRLSSFIRIITTFILSIGALSFLGIAIFTDNIQPIHDYIAFFAFVGQGFGLALFNIAIIHAILPRLHQLNPKRSLILFMITSGFVIFMLFAICLFLSMYIIENFEIMEPVLWEWLAFFGIISNLLWGQYLHGTFVIIKH
jgi:hypothetical protein